MPYQKFSLRSSVVVLLAAIFCLQTGILLAQRNRVRGPVDNARRVRLTGHVRPNLRPDDDRGRMAASEQLQGITLVLARSAEQQAALDRLLAEQQDPASPNYHHWLTPEEYADRFGVSADDVAKVSGWLEQQNLHVTDVARARTWITFSGPAGAVERAFNTEIHHFQVDGKSRFANVTEPSIPVAFDAVIRGIHGLNDFRLQPRAKRLGSAPPSTLLPNYTSTTGAHYLSPGDFAIIYNTKALYDAGFTGSGQKVVVAGQTQLDISDVQKFRTRFNLPANDPDLIQVPNAPAPGTSDDDLGESMLDIQWAGAAAPDAKIVYVYSQDVMDAVKYAIDQNLAPVITLSYGLCELQTSRAQALALQSWAQQGNAQGITWFNAAGDSGGADCVHGSSTSNGGLAVDLPAAVPEVTGIGGTQFNEGTSTFWNKTHGADGVSVLSYIPESVWNDNSADPSSGGGGASAIFAKPVWQAGPGVPNDGARDVPDVSLASSADHDGYLVYMDGGLHIFGGTSAATPAFAGIAALLNQYLVSAGVQSKPGLGNINPRLYSLAQSVPGAFHDITDGNNIVTVNCGSRARNCTSGAYGFAAGAGYDQASGLGSVDAYNLVTAWREKFNPNRSTASMALLPSAASITWSDTVILTATVTSQNGATPQGTVTFLLGSVPLGSATLSGSGGKSTATLSVSAPQLSSGGNMLTAQYSGDNAFATASASVVVTVNAPPAGTPPSIAGVTNGASFRQSYAPGALVSVFGTQLAPAIGKAVRVPLPVDMAGVSATINGVPAPLFYVSPGQLNLQIPYETPVTSQSVLRINNNGQVTSAFINVSAVAPGVFTDQSGTLVPTGRAARGQVIEIYITGAGLVTPAVANGAAPDAQTSLANLPRALQQVSVTVGNVQAPVVFSGIPAGLVGVMQINFQVPAASPLGDQPVVVSIGSVASPPATLTVQ